MSTLVYIILFTLIGSIGALIGGFILLSYEKFALKISHILSSFAAGILLGTAFFDLLPEAAHEAETTEINIFTWTLFGMIMFFLIERFIHWFHHHEEQHEHEDGIKSKSTVPLIVISDTAHNFIDGIVIAATFLIDIKLGIITTLAVLAHEIPQEIGDFALLIHKGMSRRNILMVNALSALASLAGALIAFSFGVIEEYIPVFLAITAGFFIYIATSDLIPELHHEKRRRYIIVESALLLFGLAFVWTVTSFLGHSH